MAPPAADPTAAANVAMNITEGRECGHGKPSGHQSTPCARRWAPPARPASRPTRGNSGLHSWHRASTSPIHTQRQPRRRLGRLVLGHLPDNFFAETEQVAFHPGTSCRAPTSATIRSCRVARSPTPTPRLTRLTRRAGEREEHPDEAGRRPLPRRGVPPLHDHHGPRASTPSAQAPPRPAPWAIRTDTGRRRSVGGYGAQFHRRHGARSGTGSANDRRVPAS